MPTRRVLPSPSVALAAEAVPEAAEVVAAEPPSWAAGPQAARNVIPPTLRAVSPESLRNERRETPWCWGVVMVVLPSV